jgi:hypothetical protein
MHVGLWGQGMSDGRLRVVGEPRPHVVGRACVRTNLAALLPILASAIDGQAPWLDDLAEDEIIVSADLADILDRFYLYRDLPKAA